MTVAIHSITPYIPLIHCVHAFNKYLLMTHYVPGTHWYNGDTTEWKSVASQSRHHINKRPSMSNDKWHEESYAGRGNWKCYLGREVGILKRVVMDSLTERGTSEQENRRTEGVSHMAPWRKSAIAKIQAGKCLAWSGSHREVKRGWSRMSEEHDGWCLGQREEDRLDGEGQRFSMGWRHLIAGVSEIHGAVFVWMFTY